MLYLTPVVSIGLFLIVAQAVPPTGVNLGSRGYRNDRLARRTHHPSGQEPSHQNAGGNPSGQSSGCREDSVGLFNTLAGQSGGTPGSQHQSVGHQNQHPENPQPPSGRRPLRPLAPKGEKRKASSPPKAQPSTSKPKTNDDSTPQIWKQNGGKYKRRYLRPICYNNEIGKHCARTCDCLSETVQPSNCLTHGHNHEKAKANKTCRKEDETLGGGCWCPRIEKTKKICPLATEENKDKKEHNFAKPCRDNCGCKRSTSKKVENCMPNGATASPLYPLIETNPMDFLTEAEDQVIRQLADEKCMGLCRCDWEVVTSEKTTGKPGSPASANPAPAYPESLPPSPVYRPTAHLTAEDDPGALRALARLEAAYIGSPRSSP